MSNFAENVTLRNSLNGDGDYNLIVSYRQKKDTGLQVDFHPFVLSAVIFLFLLLSSGKIFYVPTLKA